MDLAHVPQLSPSLLVVMARDLDLLLQAQLLPLQSTLLRLHLLVALLLLLPLVAGPPHLLLPLAVLPQLLQLVPLRPVVTAKMV